MNPSQLDVVLQYVEMREEQHRTRTFQEKYRELLRRHEIEFDERYVGLTANGSLESRFQRSFAMRLESRRGELA